MESMDMLRRIKMEYELSDVKWDMKNDTIHSDRGRKKLRIWKDKQLLEWHVKWRDELGKHSGFLVDRMIRTKSSEPFIITDVGWLSLHDFVEEKLPSKGKEKEWGKFIGAALKTGMKQNEECHRMKKTNELTLKEIRGSIERLPLIDPMTKLVLERSYFEAKNRIRKAKSLIDHAKHIKQPILAPFTTIKETRQIFLYLFLECGVGHPIRGYQPIRKLFIDWLEQNGEESLRKLVNEIDNHFSLKKEHGFLLLADILMPFEIESTIHTLHQVKTELEMNRVMTNFYNSWETSRKLVLFLSKWMESDREKVVAR